MSAPTLAGLFRSHRATVGPVSGAWYCACGAASIKGSIGAGDLTSRAEREAQWYAHLAAAVTEWLREDAQVERAARGIHAEWFHDRDECLHPDGCAPDDPDRENAIAALSAVTEERAR